MTIPNLLVIGATGQVSRALAALRPDGIFLDRTQADLAHPGRLAALLQAYAPDALINAAAYTQVDKAEAEEELATRINAESPLVMSHYCASRNIPFVTYSTDYVFDGSGETPWRETDAPAPLNAYGRSKLKGEQAIEGVPGKHLILRTSWVYDAAGKNFASAILRLAAEREELRVIADQHGAPTYAPHLAAGTLALLEKAMGRDRFPSGIYHLCNTGGTSWHGFASVLIEQARGKGMQLKAKRILPIPTAEYPTPAQRPMNSRLDCAKALSMFGVSLPEWHRGMEACMDARYENHRLPA